MTEPKPTVNQHFQINDPLKPAQSARMQTAHGREKQTSRGPRAITIQRSSAGFGFTLRHFIVYPPDSVSDCPEEWQKGMSAGLLDPMGPMDTIFVKHIRENGPAVKAGLNTGDQVVSVNGESVMCKSYAEVVGMIQKSGPTLNLVVLPKEHDILQQCFADTAHNPHTNARPVVASSASQPEPQVPGVTNKALMMSVTNHQQQSAGLVMDANALLKTNIMSHLPRPKPYQSFQVEAKKPQQQSAAGQVHPAAVPLPRQSSSGSLLQQQQQQTVPPRILSPLVAGTGTVTSPPSRSSEEAQARAAAAALVSKSVRKSVDFVAATSAGSRASYAEYPGGSFDTASKRSSFAGTPTSRSEFILSGSHPIYSQPIFQNNTSPYGTTAQGSQPSVAVSQSNYYPLYESTHVSSPSLHNQHRDSITSSKGSLGEEQQQRDVMTRIKKSFEQKEEFLKRPALPYWVNVQESNQVTPAVPREFYAQPQKFSRPIWPPSHPSSVTASVESLPESPNNSSSSSSGKPTGITTSFMTSVEPWSMVFTASKGTPPPVSPIGLVTNTVPKPFYGSANATGTQSPTGTKLFVSTLSKIHENIPSSDVDQQRRKELEIKPRISNAAPLASPEEFFTPSPTKSSQHPLAAVIKRAKQIECEKAKQAAAAAAAAAAQTTSPVILRAGKPAQIEVKLQQPPAVGSGNRTVIIGSSKLHCEPPPHDRNRPNMAMDLRAVDDPLARPFSTSPLDENSNSSSPKVVAAAVHHRRSTPHNELTSTATLSPSCLQTDIDDVLMMDCLANTSTNDEQELGSSLNRSGASSTPITSDFELSVLERFDQLLASLGTGAHSSSGAGSSAGSSSTINGQEAAEQAAKAAASHAITASVNRRQKIYDDDSDRGMRRVSYLKATANPMDGTEASNPTDVPTATPAQATPTISDHAKGRPHPPHSIQKLRSLFGDKVSTSTTNQNGNGKENLNPPSPPTESIHSAREGWLHVKQTIVDCRRSTDRSWRQLWTRIRSGQVSFYREKPPGNGSAPGPDDMVLDLRNCSIEVAIYYTKRKHVLRLSTSNGLCEYLLQCEDNNDMVHWLDSFQQEQMACSSDKDEGPSMTSYSSSEMMLVRQAHEIDSAQHHGSASQRRGMGRFTLHRNRSPTGHSPVSKTRKPSLSSSVYHSGGSVNAGTGGEASPSSTTTGGNNSNSSHKPATWRRKVAHTFNKIKGNSAGYLAGGQYGGHAVSSVPEGATIGVPLEFCPRSSLSDSIPLIVELCVGIVEARGLESVGVYRVPGNSVAVNSLTESLNRGFDCLNTSDPRWNDVNVISSLMKSFFRKLPDPLVTSELYGALIEASRTESEEQRLAAIKRLVDDLPEPHYSTLRYLIGHLSRVAAQSAVNKMEARNLAIVFGPTLIRPGDDSTVTMVTDMSHQCRIVETLIDKVDYFFPSTSELDQADASITQQTSASTAEERKEAYAREIVSSIITAARKKKHSSLDSPNLSDRNGSDPLLSVVEEKREIPSGSAHSLVELGSTGGTPALPVEASEFREATALQERKRSASLGGETALPPPTSAGGNMGELTGITELSSVDGQSCSTPEFRSRTSSGTFVPIKVPSMPNPIDAAGIRSYSGLSAVTQERIRLFEQETKALLQRDLVARQRREGDPLPIPSSAPSGPNSRVPKAEDPTWNRSKLEMETETDEFLDALEDHPSGKEEEENQGVPALMEADHLDVDTVPATEEIEVKATVPIEPVEDDPVSTASSTTENTTTSEGEVKKKEEKTTKTEVKVVRKNSGSKVPTKTPPVVAARSQVPSKLSGAAATNKSSESTNSRMPVKKTSATAPIPVARTSITGRASAAPVAGRSRTVELGKVVGSTISKKPDPANRVVVRQMSSGALLPSTSSAANKISKTAPPPSKLRMKSESPKKSVVGSTSTKNSDELKTDENSLKCVSNSTTPPLPESNLLSSIVLQSKENRPVKEGSELGQPELLGEVGKVAVKRAVEGKDSSRGVKRSDSLTKDEKTENNTKEKERSSGRSSRRFIQRGETGLKRRHTVGGTRDFDKVRIRWLADGSDGKSVVPAPRWSAWDRLQPLISDEDLNVDRSLKTWMRSERMRTSSPELCRRSDQAATPLQVPTSTVE